MEHSFQEVQHELSFLYSILASAEKLDISQLTHVGLDTSYQPEVAGEMDHCLRIGALGVGRKMGGNNDHMEHNLEDNGVGERPEVVAGIWDEGVEYLLSSA